MMREICKTCVCGLTGAVRSLSQAVRTPVLTAKEKVAEQGSATSLFVDVIIHKGGTFRQGRSPDGTELPSTAL